MAKQCSKADQGVPSFSYCPADRKYPLLFELTRPLDDLDGMLHEAFAGQTRPCVRSSRSTTSAGRT
jgi:hypothetical protein